MTTPQNSSAPESSPEDELNPIAFKEFLEQYPLNTIQYVSGYYEQRPPYMAVKIVPQLSLWCNNEGCMGIRRFDGKWENSTETGIKKSVHDFLIYSCRDCGNEQKVYCIRSIACEGGLGFVIKIGEYPDMHISIPQYLPKLLGDEYPYFVKGLKCEKQGFGIAAFSYYRRVVEKQKGRMFEKMAEAAKRIDMAPEVIENLQKAAKEDRFSQAIEDVNDHIPDSFKVNGHNPMKILYSVLSDGIHDRTDEECLTLAHDLRIVLQDMSQRIKDALRDDAEAKSALSNLLKRHSNKK